MARLGATVKEYAVVVPVVPVVLSVIDLIGLAGLAYGNRWAYKVAT